MSVMPSNHLILCHPVLLPSMFPSIRVFSNESVLCIRWPKYWSFSFSISPSNKYLLDAFIVPCGSAFIILVAQRVKRLPTMRETGVQSLGWEGLLEKDMATHSGILTWKIPWTEEPVGYSPWGCKELDTTERLHFSFLHLLKNM